MDVALFNLIIIFTRKHHMVSIISFIAKKRAVRSFQEVMKYKFKFLPLELSFYDLYEFLWSIAIIYILFYGTMTK